jgi:hydroxymethylpyrimidine pyrophosphatase-like HAD family hydrolase
MIMHTEATKFNAVRLLTERFGVKIEQTAAFGDDMADISMLRQCGVGVAM